VTSEAGSSYIKSEMTDSAKPMTKNAVSPIHFKSCQSISVDGISLMQHGKDLADVLAGPRVEFVVDFLAFILPAVMLVTPGVRALQLDVLHRPVAVIVEIERLPVNGW